ncbi:unnamed protein product, partial [Polarella glacialis]
LAGPSPNKTLKVCGYAYTGGGNKIIRGEISLDSGKSWEIANLTRPEDEIAAARGTDKHWCWSWFETEVDVAKLEGCHEICCRAWDSNQNSQPFQLTWNVMGMLSNTIFRIKIHQMKDAEGLDAIWFEHPTMPGAEAGGWMTEEAGKFDASIASEAAAGSTGSPPSRAVAAVWKSEDVAAIGSAAAGGKGSEKGTPVDYTIAGKAVTSTAEWLSNGISMEEVEKHSDEKSVFFVVKGRVYDGTPFLEKHPGGASSMLIVAGQEASEDFEAVHSKAAWEQLEEHYIGRLQESGSATASAVVAVRPSLSNLVGAVLRLLAFPLLNVLWPRLSQLAGALFGPKAPEKVFLNPRLTQQLPLVEKIIVSEDARIFRFALPSKTMRLGLPTGMHIFLKIV